MGPLSSLSELSRRCSPLIDAFLRTSILPSACMFALGLLAVHQLVHAAWLITYPSYTTASHQTVGVDKHIQQWVKCAAFIIRICCLLKTNLAPGAFFLFVCLKYKILFYQMSYFQDCAAFHWHPGRATWWTGCSSQLTPTWLAAAVQWVCRESKQVTHTHLHKHAHTHTCERGLSVCWCQQWAKRRRVARAHAAHGSVIRALSVCVSGSWTEEFQILIRFGQT